MGPPSCYWAFGMERFCGSLLPAIKSRRHPFVNIDRRVHDLMMLSHIQQLCSVDLSIASRRRHIESSSRDHFPNYPHAELIGHAPELTLSGDLFNKTRICLLTRYNKQGNFINRFIPASVKQWKKVLRLGGGDLMVARNASPLANGYRDSSFVRYELLFNRLTNQSGRTGFEPRMFYGQLLRVFKIDVPASTQLGTVEPETILLAAIRQCTITHVDKYLGTPYYTVMGPVEVVDLQTVQCIVGRVHDERGHWGIVDRSRPLAQAEFRGDEPNDGEV
ncbi:hypothetical protein FRC08_007445 [Ceratobasidium sp. 394]|nr:hypothetical protein FRC08_007445 [Ceratobasidium sp. 394]